MRRSASLSSWRAPRKTVSRVERRTGLQSHGSAQSQMMPRAHGCICSWVMMRVGGRVAALPRRSASHAASASRIHDSIWSTYTPSR